MSLRLQIHYKFFSEYYLIAHSTWRVNMTTFYLIRHGKHNYDLVSGKNFIGHGFELAPLIEEGINQAIECSKDYRL
jgi:hypothetical protein